MIFDILNNEKFEKDFTKVVEFIEKSFKEEVMKGEKIEEEVFEVVKNGVKTTMKLYFNSKGMPVNHHIVSENIVEAKLASLQKQMDLAIKTMDFETAIKLREQIKEIKGSQ